MTIIDNAKAAAPLADRGGAPSEYTLPPPTVSTVGGRVSVGPGYLLISLADSPAARVHQLEALLTQAQAEAREQRARDANKEGVSG